jgi:hypothetical protein
MRPGCKELGLPRLSTLPLNLENVFAEYPDPPGDVPIYIRDWVFQYRHLREEWNGIQISRGYFCDLWR